MPPPVQAAEDHLGDLRAAHKERRLRIPYTIFTSAQATAILEEMADVVTGSGRHARHAQATDPGLIRCACGLLVPLGFFTAVS